VKIDTNNDSIPRWRFWGYCVVNAICIACTAGKFANYAGKLSSDCGKNTCTLYSKWDHIEGSSDEAPGKGVKHIVPFACDSATLEVVLVRMQ
jgi:hypothetical protein